MQSPELLYPSVFHFLRKEKIYTKLKYSRCPQYDIVSGGIAALFSALLGFLISEKFGLELLDSGDFYCAFMYTVFAVFTVRPLLRLVSVKTSNYTPLSIKPMFLYYQGLFAVMATSVKVVLCFIAPHSYY